MTHSHTRTTHSYSRMTHSHSRTNDGHRLMHNDVSLMSNSHRLTDNDDSLLCNGYRLMHNDDSLMSNGHRLMHNDDSLMSNCHRLMGNGLTPIIIDSTEGGNTAINQKMLSFYFVGIPSRVLIDGAVLFFQSVFKQLKNALVFIHPRGGFYKSMIFHRVCR